MGHMTALSVLGIDNILFAVGRLPEAMRFYAEVLGLPVKFHVPEAGIALFAIGQEEPGLLVRAQAIDESAARTSPRVWLEVPDARAAAEEIRRRGVSVLAEPFEVYTGWAFEIADPWGNVVGFTDYLKDPSRSRPH
jgi:predicted enzyme related to lactoylglutathione lyase